MKNVSEIKMSIHASKRSTQRRLNENVIALCLKFGQKFFRTGITFYVLTKKIIQKFNLPDKLEGICVLEGQNTIISVYKNKDITSKIKHLSKRDLAFRAY